MGQYYRAVLVNGDGKVITSDRSLVGQGYTMAKLTEHSWFGNPFCDTVGFYLYKKPRKVIWCGDYAEDSEIETLKIEGTNMRVIWGDDFVDTPLEPHEFDWKNKFIINLDKGVVINVNHYWNGSIIEVGKENEPWVLNPIPILCAIGNGRGGGDYRGLCMDYVGTWAGDTIVIDDRNWVAYEEFIVAFKEECYCE